MMNMEGILTEVVPQADLEHSEKMYHRELADKNVTVKTQFEYALCLVRSQYTTDMKRGIVLFEDLSARHAEGNRDYIYYLAIANARLKNYNIALKYVKAFLQVEPNNMQVISLEELIMKKQERDGMIGIAVASGAAIVCGGLIGLGMALMKK